METGQGKRGLSTAQWAFLTAVAVAVIGLVPVLLDRFAPADDPTPPAPTAASSAAPTTPAAEEFQLTSSRSVPQCSDVTGRGTAPPGREMGLFVQFPGDTKYFWEQKLTYTGGEWRAQRVVIGAPNDSGKQFHLVLVPLSAQAVVEFKKHDGTAYSVETLPVEAVARFAVVRNDQLGNC